MSDRSTPLTYAASGVDIDAGNALVDVIKPMAKATARPGVMAQLGGFGALFDLKAAGYDDPILVAGTDGVGTKLKLAIDSGKHDTIGIDLVAMCVNDLVVQGAEPLFFLDYYANGGLAGTDSAAILQGVAEGCKQAECALIGGETAEMPGLYAPGDYDLAGFAVGAVNRDAILPDTASMRASDVLIGLTSSGLHSNGFSLVRKILERQDITLGGQPPFADASWADVLLEPTRIYVKACLKAAKTHTQAVRGFAHITGGGLPENLPRVLPDALGAKIERKSWQEPALFDWLKANGPVEEGEMLRTFNCGIGMVVIVAAEDAESVIHTLEEAGETALPIGELVAWDGASARVEIA